MPLCPYKTRCIDDSPRQPQRCFTATMATLMDVVESDLGQDMALTCEADLLDTFPLDDGGLADFCELLESDPEYAGIDPVYTHLSLSRAPQCTHAIVAFRRASRGYVSCWRNWEVTHCRLRSSKTLQGWQRKSTLPSTALSLSLGASRSLLLPYRPMEGMVSTSGVKATLTLMAWHLKSIFREPRPTRRVRRYGKSSASF